MAIKTCVGKDNKNRWTFLSFGIKIEMMEFS